MSRMLDAYHKDQRIHRDISVGNIIIYRDGTGVRRGYLVDWELSCRPDFKGKARDYWRTATWQFMSTRILDASQRVQHSLQDDMESLLYVVLYCSLRWLSHNLPGEDLYSTMQLLFQHHGKVSGKDVGGGGKSSNMLYRTYTNDVRFENPLLHHWLNTVMDYHRLPDDRGGPDPSKWENPNYLNTFWKNFLQISTLPTNDRVEHELPNPPRDPAKDPHEATVPSTSNSLGKRKESSSPPEDEPIEGNVAQRNLTTDRSTESTQPTVTHRRSLRLGSKSNARGCENTLTTTSNNYDKSAGHANTKGRPKKKVRFSAQ
ncbi:hypothetical protein A0H81_08675 [Grifola frondosa]|uniref:Fungal-type protein kinase domain-containing protein n=1 Tax=Grifola frondosa TaxID=5627 RepID=A0A1C7M2G4_GRIFR|nr:hypothetical protein A0H81_08675 [Grifola frondosa]